MHNKSGFSLIELLVSISLISIILSLGVPGLINYREKARLGGFARDVYAIFQRAKMEAARRNQNIMVSFNQAGCDYVMFINDFDPANQVYNPADETAIACLNRPAGVTDSFEEFPGAYIIFANTGLPVDVNSNLAKGKVQLAMGTRTSTVAVSLAGNIKIEKYAK
jgi:type IV fimbrial biogenesis protein FimT